MHLVERSFRITQTATKIQIGNLIDTPSVANLTGKKVDPDGNGLSGAVIGLFSSDATEFTEEQANMTAISGENGTFQFDSIPAGDYIVHEIQAPAGYILSDKSYPITVDRDGTIPLCEDLVNIPTEIKTEKTDPEGKPLSGAVMQIMALANASVNAGTIVERWTTDDTAYSIIGKLEVGAYYQLQEVTPPDGYTAAPGIVFTIDTDGNLIDNDGNPLESLTMIDHPTVVTVTKHDENEELLPGAVMQILDASGKVVEEWVTDTEPHIITAKLAVGAEYVLHEEKAPDGYYREDDITFTVPNNGEIALDMVDYTTTSVIQKRDSNRRPVIGAVLQILAPDGTVVEEWTTDGTAHRVEGILNPDTTYTLHEKETPAGYFTAEDIPFSVNAKGEMISPVIMTDVKYGDLLVGKLSDIQQQSESGAVIFMAGAVLQLLDKDGTVLDEWTTETSQHTIDAILQPGESYVLHEVSAPDGFCIAEDIHFTLNEKGEFLNAAEGQEVLRIAAAEEFDYAEVDQLGSYRQDLSYNQKHIDSVLALDLVDVEAIRKANFRVAIDCVNSVGGIILPQLLEQLGVQHVEKLYCEPTGNFQHNPEPLEKNLGDIMNLMKGGKADVAFVVDPDVDRLAMICEDGKMYGEEYTLVTVADYVLKHTPGNTVSNLSSTRALRDVTRKYGQEYYASAVGEVNVTTKMKEVGAVIGGEGNGGVIYPASHYGRDALVGIALFLSHLAHEGKKVSELRASYPAYFMAKNRVDLTPETDVDAILAKVKELYKNEEINDIDGVKIDFPDKWVHLRKSNTEPIIRVYSEAATPEAAEEIGQQIMKVIEDLAK